MAGRAARAGAAAATVAVAAAVVALVGVAIPPATGGPAPAASFTAAGSAEQVYVTGLAPSAQASLVNSKGQTVYTQSADSLGGLLFRNVRPGGGYRVHLDRRRIGVTPRHGAL